MKYRLSVVTAVSLVALYMPDARAYTILGPGDSVAGQSIADWTQAWWTRYWTSRTAAIDPATGNIRVGLNNGGPVVFAPTTDGSPGLGQVTIDFSMSVGRALLVPLIPFSDLEAASVDGNAPLADRKQAANIVVAGQLGSVVTSSLFASIDGTAVSDPSSHVEETGLFSAGPAKPHTLPVSQGVAVGDELFPIKAAGYWLMIEGLSIGQHTLQLQAQSVPFTPDPNCCTNFPIGPFSIEVTENISVVPEPPSAVLFLMGLLGLFALGRKPITKA